MCTLHVRVRQYAPACRGDEILIHSLWLCASMKMCVYANNVPGQVHFAVVTLLLHAARHTRQIEKVKMRPETVQGPLCVAVMVCGADWATKMSSSPRD